MNRGGMALVAVLWAVTLLAGAVGLAAAAVRLGQRTSANRLALVRGRWAAEACLAIAAARSARDRLSDTATVSLGRTVTCTWTVERPDGRLDANHATRDVLERLAQGVGLDDDAARGLADAVLDARRSGEITDLTQLTDLPGADPRLLPHLTVDGSGRVDAAAAAPVVLASLPGMTPEAVDLIVRRRTVGTPLRTLDELAGALSPAGRAALLADYAVLAPVLRFRSSRLLLTARGWVASHGAHPRASVELLVERLPDRLAVLRRRIR